MMEYKQARKVLIYTLFLNWLVALAKLSYGILTRSASMTADGLHSFADGTNNIVGLVGFYIASRPVDKSHPYGHEKYETLTALGVGGILLLVAFNILKNAVQRFNNPVIPEVNAGSFIIMIITVAVNIFVMTYEHREGKRLKSDFLVSDSYHTRSDILVSGSVIATLIAVKLGIPIIDTVVAVLIAFFVGFSAFEILWQTSKVLSDAAVIPPETVKNIVMGFNEVVNCHNIRTRGRQDNICVDLHIWVRPTMQIDMSHELVHKIEKKLKEEIPDVREVIIHIEPVQK
ncbi:MAG: cation diffusion facilitator family transporter [bacterium]